MQKTRFTEEQMVTILREADQRPVPEVAKKHGVSSQTIYAWRKHFGSLEPTDIKRLRQLEQENGRLKKMVADRDLEIDVLKEITRKIVGARLRRQQVAYARSRGLSGRRACAVLVVARSTLGYQSRLVARDALPLAAMRRLAAQYPRYGYRRIRIFLKREGHAMSPDRTHRLWRQAGLQVPRRRPRRRAASLRELPSGTPVVIKRRDGKEEVVVLVRVKQKRFIAKDPSGRSVDLAVRDFLRPHMENRPT